jgi:signal transduction histidine kinase
METGYRGFLLTGNESYLDPYSAGRERLPQTLSTLLRETADNPAQTARWQDLQLKVDEWLRVVTEPNIAQRRAALGLTVPPEVIASVATGEGKQRVDAMRAIFAAALADEQSRLEARDAQAEVASRTLLGTLVGGTALAIVLAVVIASLLGRDLSQAIERLAAVAQRIAGGDLDERIGLDRQDEVGRAAAAFDHMAAQQQATIDRLGESEAALLVQRAELQRSNRELQDFASVASHDLQEPLRKVQAFGDRLKARYGDSLPPEGQDYLARMQDAAGRMSTLINDLLTFSRVTTRAQPFTSVALEDVVHTVVGDLDARLTDTGGIVQVGPLPVIQADPTQMRQLFQNLIANGLKFHQPDVPPRVEVTAQTLPGDSQADWGPWVQVTVADNGIGFDEKYLDRIFTIFQRLHGRGEYEGTGIGLAVCRKIVERHGGTITARSSPGEGATFIVELPLTPLASDGSVLAAATANGRTS